MSRSRWIGLLFLLVLMPLVVAGGVLLRAHRLLADPGTLARGFSVGLGRGLTSDSFDVAFWPPGYVLRGVELADQSKYGSGELAHVDAIWLQAGIASLVRGEVRIEEVVLEKPTLRVVLGPEGWNLGASEQYLETPEAFDVQRVTATGLRLVYRDRTRPGVAEFELRQGELSAFRKGVDEGWSVEVSGATEGMGPPDAPPGSVKMQLQTPARDEANLRIEGSLDGLQGARVGELAQLIGSDMPFGTQLGGRLSGRLVAVVGAGSVGGRSSLVADLDLADAELRTREGLVLKPRGLASQVHMEGSGNGEALRLDLFETETAGLKIRARREANADGLVLDGSDLNGRGLENVLPLLTGIRPRGKFSLQGKVEEVEQGGRLRVELSGEELTLLPEEDRWTVGQLSLSLGLRDDGDYLVVARAQEVRGQSFVLENLAIGYLARTGVVPMLDLHAQGLLRDGARMDDFWLQGEMAEVSRLRGKVALRSFGGNGSGAVSLERVDPGWRTTLDLNWSDLEIPDLAALLGRDLSLQGAISGSTQLTGAGADVNELLESLTGPLSVRIDQARFVAMDPLRLAGGALGRIPLVGGRLKRRLTRAGRQMEVSGSDSLTLVAEGPWREGRHRLERLDLSGALYEFSGRGALALSGTLDLTGDLVVRGRAADELRMGDPRFGVVLGKTGPIVFPVTVEGVYPDLTVLPETSFLGELSRRARRGGRSLGENIGQQLQEALAP